MWAPFLGLYARACGLDFTHTITEAKFNSAQNINRCVLQLFIIVRILMSLGSFSIVLLDEIFTQVNFFFL